MNNTDLNQSTPDLEFDLQYFKDQKSILEDAIKNGNWDGYKQSLSNRKQRLKRTQSFIDALTKEIEARTKLVNEQ